MGLYRHSADVPKRYNLFMNTQNEPRPDFVEVIPYKEHFIEANIYKQPTHFKALGGGAEAISTAT